MKWEDCAPSSVVEEINKRDIVKKLWEASDGDTEYKVEYYVGTGDYDPVNKPSHYNQYDVEVIELIQEALTADEFNGYLLGNMLKYRLRAGLKDKSKRMEDLEKSNWYQDKLRLVEDKLTSCNSL